MTESIHDRVRRRRRWSASLGAVAVAGLALAGCSAGTGGPTSAASGASDSDLEAALASMAPTELVYSINLPDTSSVGLAVKAFKAYVEEKTKGKITIDDEYNSVVTPAEKALEAVQNGTADIALTSTTYYTEKLPVSNLVQNLGAASDPSFPAGWLQALGAGTEFFSKDPAIAAEWGQYDAKVLYATSPSRYALLCTKPVDTVDQAKGLQTRSSGTVWSNEVKAMGMTPVSLPISELYEGLQRGVVDCVTSTPDTLGSLKITEVAKHYIPVQMSTQVTGVVFMNSKVYDGFPAPVQRVIDEASLQGYRAYVDFVAKAAGDFFNTLPKDAVVHDPAALDALLVAEQRDAEGTFLASTNIPDAKAIVGRYQDTIDKWFATVTKDLGISTGSRDVASIVDGYKKGSTLDLDPFIGAVQKALG